jgi:hypothetical protein
MSGLRSMAAGAFAVLALACAAPGVAWASEVTFEAFAPTETPLPTTTSFDGLDFTSAAFHYVWGGEGVGDSKGLIYSGQSAGIPLTISRTGGGAFFLQSLAYATSFGHSASPISYTLNFAGGGSANGALSLGEAFQTLIVNANLSSIVLGASDGDNYTAIDNVNYTLAAVPEPATWAMMVLGFGGAGALLRRRGGGRTYRLVERAPDGRTVTEEFRAPDDASAVSRAQAVAEGPLVEVWRGATLVQRYEGRLAL